MWNPIRTIARQLLASMFITGGMDALLHSEEKAPRVDDVLTPATQGIPQLESLSTPEMVRINAGVQVVGGLMLALGKAPRVASAALAASLVPTTLAAHRFWEEEDPASRTNQQVHFTKNLSMLGGLLLAALDTEGRPGVAWRTKHAVEHAGIHADHARRTAATKADRAKAETALRAERMKRKLTPDVGDAKRLVSAVRD